MSTCKICDGDLLDTGSIQCGLIHQKFQEEMKRTSKIQKELLKKNQCPNCQHKNSLYESETEDEALLICDKCNATIDRDGGMIT